MGRHIAELEIKKVIPTLLLMFSVSRRPIYTSAIKFWGQINVQADDAQQPRHVNAFPGGNN